MPKKLKLSDTEQVQAHVESLAPTLQDAVNEIRQVFLSFKKDIEERIKWNNPSFYYTGQMKEFDPKEHKRDIAVFNLHKGQIMLVFPTGAKVNDDSGLLEGKYEDGRRIALFADAEDVRGKKKQLYNVIKKWILLVDR